MTRGVVAMLHGTTAPVAGQLIVGLVPKSEFWLVHCSVPPTHSVAGEPVQNASTVPMVKPAIGLTYVAGTMPPGSVPTRRTSPAEDGAIERTWPTLDEMRFSTHLPVESLSVSKNTPPGPCVPATRTVVAGA